MPLFLVPILVGAVGGAAGGAAAYGAMTQDEAGDYSANAGGRQLNAHQIYEQLRAGDNGSSLMTGRDSASTLKNSFGERIGEMDALASRMDEAWQGDSAEAAKAGAHPLKQWLEDSQTKLYESDNTMASQLDAFNTVMSQVQPVPAQPPESDFLNDITPWTTDTDRAIQQYNAMAQANVEAYNAYYSVSSANGHSMPRYTTVDGEFGDVEVDGTGGGGGAGGDVGGGGYPGGGGGAGGGGAVPGGSYPGGGGGVGGGGVPGGSYPGGGVPGGSYPGGGGGGIGGGGVPGGSYPGGSYPGGSYPGGGVPGGPYPGTGPGFDFTPGEPDDSTNASHFVPRAPTTDFTPIGGGGTTPSPNFATGGGAGGGIGSGGGAGGFGAGGFGAGAVAGGALGAGALGAGSPGTASGTAAPGASSGMAAGRAAMGGAAAAGAGARGMGGMPMGAMGGAGARGQGAEDEEHQTKYLLEEDGDSLFGSDELTAPPVIGE